MTKCVITGTNNPLGEMLSKLLEKEYTIVNINDDIFKTKDWKTKLKDILNEASPSLIFHTLEINDDDLNKVMICNYEFTRILSDYSFIKNIKMIYSIITNEYDDKILPKTINGWSKYTSEILVTQNGGVVIKSNKNDLNKILEANIFASENYEEFEFNSHNF